MQRADGLSVVEQSLRRAEQEIARLQAALTEARAAHSAAQRDVASLESRLSGAVMQLESTTSLMGTAQHEHERLKQQREILLDEKSSRITALKAELLEAVNAGNARLQRLQAQLDSTNREKLDRTAQLQQAQARISKLEEAQRAHEEQATKFGQSLNDLRALLAGKESLIMQQQAELDVSLEAKQAMESRLETLKISSDRTTKQLHALLEDREKRLKALEAQYEEARVDHQHRVGVLEGIVNQLHTELADKDFSLAQSIKDRSGLISNLDGEAQVVSLLTSLVGVDRDSQQATPARRAYASPHTNDSLATSTPRHAIPYQSSSASAAQSPASAPTTLLRPLAASTSRSSLHLSAQPAPLSASSHTSPSGQTQSTASHSYSSASYNSLSQTSPNQSQSSRQPIAYGHASTSQTIMVSATNGTYTHTSTSYSNEHVSQSDHISAVVQQNETEA